MDGWSWPAPERRCKWSEQRWAPSKGVLEQEWRDQIVQEMASVGVAMEERVFLPLDDEPQETKKPCSPTLQRG